MKKFLLTMFVFLFTFLLKAQENNPYNQFGPDYVKSVKLITEDFKAGKVKEFTKETLEEYSKKIPLKNEVNMDIVSAVFKTIKSRDFDFVKFIDQSSLSEISKNTFITLATNPEKLDLEKLRGYMQIKVDEIQKSDISNSEKEMVLSLVAIAYSTSFEPLERANSNCEASGPQGTGPIPCIVAGVIGGGIIGWEICGLWCGIGGAIIGGIAGALS